MYLALVLYYSFFYQKDTDISCYYSHNHWKLLNLICSNTVYNEKFDFLQTNSSSQISGEVSCLDVRFDDPTAGFFIRAASSNSKTNSQIFSSSFPNFNNGTGEDAVIHRSR